MASIKQTWTWKRWWTLARSVTRFTLSPSSCCLAESCRLDLLVESVHLLHTMSCYQDLHHMLLSSAVQHKKFPISDIRSQYPHRQLGSRYFPCLCRTVPSSQSVLGQKHWRSLFWREQVLHRQPGLQRHYGFRHIGLAYSHDLGATKSMAGQARFEWRIRPRCFCLFR